MPYILATSWPGDYRRMLMTLRQFRGCLGGGSTKLSIMATEELRVMLAVLCAKKEKEKKEKSIVDPLLGIMKRTVWAVCPSKTT